MTGTDKDSAARVIRATVCGSFNRFLKEVAEDVEHLRDLGVEILSPKIPKATAEESGFIYVASDVKHGIREVQDKHLRAIKNSDFVWLRCPGGYVGMSAAMEIGFATASGVPVFTLTEPKYPEVARRVRVVESHLAAVKAVLEEEGEKP